MHVSHAFHTLSKFSMSTLKIWVLKSGNLKIVLHLYEHGTKANIGGAKMANNRHTVNSFKAIGRQLDYHYTVVSRLVSKNQTNTMKDLTGSGRHHVTSRREDKALHHLIRRITPDLKRQWLPNRRLSTGIVRNHLKSTGLKSRRVIKCPMVSNQLQRLRCHGV
jgi:hypothetical protein